MKNNKAEGKAGGEGTEKKGAKAQRHRHKVKWRRPQVVRRKLDHDHESLIYFVIPSEAVYGRPLEGNPETCDHESRVLTLNPPEAERLTYFCNQRHEIP